MTAAVPELLPMELDLIWPASGWLASAHTPWPLLTLIYEDFN